MMDVRVRDLTLHVYRDLYHFWFRCVPFNCLILMRTQPQVKIFITNLFDSKSTIKNVLAVHSNPKNACALREINEHPLKICYTMFHLNIDNFSALLLFFKINTLVELIVVNFFPIFVLS